MIFLRSLVVSCFTTALEVGLFGAGLAFEHALHGHVVLLRWLAGLVGAVANFALNRNLVFSKASEPRGHSSRSSAHVRRGASVRYAIAAIGAVSLATLLWRGLTAISTIDPRILHPVSMAVIWMLFTFPTMRWWVFAHQPHRLHAEATAHPREARGRPSFPFADRIGE